MTDATVAYQQDVGRRRNVAKSALCKKNGPRVAKLGNKPLTNKEIEERHGPIMTYAMGGFPTYEEFQAFPSDLKIEYVNKLMNEYDIELCHISRYLFNKGDDGLKANLRNEYIGEDRLLKFCDYQKPRASTGLLRFQADIASWRRKEELLKAIDESEGKRKRDIIENGELITLDVFKTFTINEQIKYCNTMIEKYNVSLKALSSILFEKDGSNLRMHFKRNNVNVQDKILQYHHHGPEAYNICKEFRRIVREWKGLPAEEEEIKETVAKSTKPGTHYVLNKEPLGKDKLSKILGAFISYDQYKQLAVNDQVKWLNSIIDLYGVSIERVSVILFDKSRTTLSQGLRNNHVIEDIHKIQSRDVAERQPYIVKFKKAVDLWKGLPVEEENVAAEPIKAIETPDDAFENDLITKIVGTHGFTEAMDKEREERMQQTIEEFKKMESEPVDSIQTKEYKSSYTSDYESVGLDGLDLELEALKKLYANKHIHILLQIQTVGEA